MEDEYFNFSPVEKKPAKVGNFKQKDVQDWKWMDFWNYFEDQYSRHCGYHWITMKQRNSKKAVIEQSYNYWGKDVFKAMIDWLFENYKDFPQWKEVNMGLICGAHYWAKMIAEKAKEQMETDKKWKR
jgi:hypothetical protein